MMLAPLKTNLMAPLSTCWCGRMKGSMKKKREFLISMRKTHINTASMRRSYIYATVWALGRTVLLSVWRRAALHSLSGFQCVHGCGKNYRNINCITKSITLTTRCQKNTKSYHLTIFTGSFFGIMWLSHDSMSGNCSSSWFLMPLITDVFSWIQLDTFSFSSNLKQKILILIFL